MPVRGAAIPWPTTPLTPSLSSDQIQAFGLEPKTSVSCTAVHMVSSCLCLNALNLASA